MTASLNKLQTFADEKKKSQFFRVILRVRMPWLRVVLILPVDGPADSILCRQLHHFHVGELLGIYTSYYSILFCDWIVNTRSKEIRILACQRGPPLNCCIAG
jgi:hypothetical protein